MASFNLTVEDSSPLISYAPEGAWTNPSDDPLLESYSERSFHRSTSQGAQATIKFNGTGIHIFGANRPDYGTYEFSLDGQLVSEGDAQSQTEDFNLLLASTTGLPNGPHTAVFTSIGNGPIDVDRIELMTEIGASGSQLKATTFDDTNPSIVYSPSPDDWRINTSDNYMNSSLHFSSVPGASASLNFTGEAFAFWSTVAPDRSNTQITLDGQPLMNCNGSATSLHPQTLMYFTNDLGSGSHSLTLTASGGGPYIDLDSIQVWSTNADSSTNPSPSPSSTNSVATGSIKKAVSGGTIAAIVVSVIFLLSAVTGVGFVVLRRRRQRQRQRQTELRSSQSSDLPGLPIQQIPSIMESGMRSAIKPAFNFSRPFPSTPSGSSSIYAKESIDTPLATSRRSSLSINSTTPIMPTVTVSEPPPAEPAKTRFLIDQPVRPVNKGGLSASTMVSSSINAPAGPFRALRVKSVQPEIVYPGGSE